MRNCFAENEMNIFLEFTGLPTPPTTFGGAGIRGNWEKYNRRRIMVMALIQRSNVNYYKQRIYGLKMGPKKL